MKDKKYISKVLKTIIMKKTFVLFLISLFTAYTLNVDFYYSSFCPHCHKVLESGILDNIKEKYNVSLNEYDVGNINYAKKMIEIQKYYNEHYNTSLYVGGVPFIVIYDKNWKNGSVLQGDDQIIKNLNSVILKCVKKCEKNNTRINESHVTSINNNITISYNTSEQKKSNIEELIKKTDKNDIVGKLFLTLSLSAADSINPCIMAILTLLLATLSKSDQKKAVKYAILFIIVVFISYYIIGLMLFYSMNLIINMFAFNYGKYIILLSCLILLIIGLINLKEFFFFGKGISLKLPEKYVKTTKKLLEEGTSLSIIILAGLITIIEFPCSGVMYLGFSSAFISWHSSIFEYSIYLFLYNIIFVLPLILITYGYIITNDIEQFKKFRLKYRRLFRLVMGIIMICLAIWLYLHYFGT